MGEAPSKIGIFGGTFNPVHLGHLLIAQDAMEQMGMHRVKFIPAALPPHKTSIPLAAAQHRLNMLRLGLRGNHHFEVDDIEIKRGGRSYSVETVTELHRHHPGAKFYFIIGSDSLHELHLWKDVQRLTKLCTLVTVSRPGFASKLIKQFNLDATTVRRIKRYVVQGHACSIASREIRLRIAQGKSIRYLVPDSVIKYIGAQKLYR